jgi:hypothetical protein
VDPLGLIPLQSVPARPPKTVTVPVVVYAEAPETDLIVGPAPKAGTEKQAKRKRRNLIL